MRLIFGKYLAGPAAHDVTPVVRNARWTEVDAGGSAGAQGAPSAAGATEIQAESTAWRREPPVTEVQAEWQRRAHAHAAARGGTWRSIVPQKLSVSAEKFKSYNRTCEASGVRAEPVHEEGDELPLMGLTFCFTGVLQWWPLKVRTC